MRFLHPVSVLSFGSKALPSDLALEARDTLTLYQVLEDTPGILTAEEREQLRPQNFFSSSRPLRQEDILGYESELKRVVVTLMDTGTEAGTEEDSSLSAVTRRLTDSHIAEMGNSQLNMLPDRKEFLRNLLELLSDLHVQGDLVSNYFVSALISHHFRTTFRSPRSFLASTAPPVRRLLTVLSESWRKGKNNGERRLLNGQRKCKHTVLGKPEQDSGRNRKNVQRSNDLTEGTIRKISRQRHHGRHHLTLRSLPRISVSLGTTSTFRKEMWIMKSLTLLGGAEWTNEFLRP